ncbi:MAG: hypothetical protein FWB73_00940 [Treponema sp.]|nr:hypothetical protein [Treponema sp.]
MLKLTNDIISDIESESVNVSHGVITVEFHIRNDKIRNYKIGKEKSVMVNHNDSVTIVPLKG